MRNSKVFGISVNLIAYTSYFYPQTDYMAICRDYVDAITLAGGVPIMLPLVTSKDAIFEQLSHIDVLVLSGGSDINPIWYGEEPLSKIEMVIDERDRYEIELINMADKMQIPIFGICRGLQLLNVAFGGTLYQDLSQINTPILHRQTARRFEPSHTVDVKIPSLLYNIVEEKSIFTNSYHHQAVKEVAPDFTVNAISKDGIVEGIEREGNAPIIAVQWHPEMMAVQDNTMLKLFQYFI